MYDKLMYSIIWMIGLLYLLGWVVKHQALGWYLWLYWILVIAILMQVLVIVYHASDAYTRHRFWQKMRGKP
jgi:uncharacterized membrane protein YbhN (UPF0104 family)